MKAGRDLDAAVARALGWAALGCREEDGSLIGHRPGSGPMTIQDVPAYSTDIWAAFQVVEAVKELHHLELHRRVGGGWEALEACGDYIAEWTGAGETAAHAICEAALSAVAKRGGRRVLAPRAR